MAQKKVTEEDTQEQAQGQTSAPKANAPEGSHSEVKTPVILIASSTEELNSKVEEFISANPGAVAGCIGYDQMTRIYSIRIDIINN